MITLVKEVPETAHVLTCVSASAIHQPHNHRNSNPLWELDTFLLPLFLRIVEAFSLLSQLTPSFHLPTDAFSRKIIHSWPVLIFTSF